MGCDCGRVPESFPEPLPRWVILPGDPVDLRRWLRDKQADETEATEPHAVEEAS